MRLSVHAHFESKIPQQLKGFLFLFSFLGIGLENSPETLEFQVLNKCSYVVALEHVRVETR